MNDGSSGGHLPVKALVTQLSLTLSTHTLTLTEAPLSRQNSGMTYTLTPSLFYIHILYHMHFFT